MRIIVQKFGGTSVAGPEPMHRARERVREALSRGYKVAVVLSAMAGETDRLLDWAHRVSPNPDPRELDALLSTGEQTSVALFSMLLQDVGVTARSLSGYQAGISTNCNFGNARILDINSRRLKDMFAEYDALVVAGFQGCDKDLRVTTLGRGGSDTTAVALAVATEAEVCEIYTDVEGT